MSVNKLKIRYSTIGIFFLLLIPTIFLIGQHAMLNMYGIRKHISEGVILAATLDFAATWLLIVLVFFKYNNYIQKIKLHWSNSYSKSDDYRFLLILNTIFIFLTLLYAPEFLKLIIQGVTRQAIYDQVDSMPFLLTMADKYFLVASIFVLFTNAPGKVKIYTIFGFLLTTIVMTSRSNLMFFLLLYIIISLIKFRVKDLKRLSVVAAFIVGLSVLFGIYVQNRLSSAIFLGPLKPVEDLFLYQSYSLYLAMISSSFAQEHDKFVYPFLGYASEYFYRLFGGVNFVGSDFVMNFHVFRSDIRTHSANVLYPWWSWFYGVFGLSGILLKAIYVWSLLCFSLLIRSFPLFVLMLYWTLFTGFTKHPLITLDAFMMLFFTIIIGLYCKIKI